MVGIGPVLAARILGEVGDVHRFPTRDHFASANGTAPIPASSGRTDRYRLNRGGNRRLDRALYFAALTQASHDPRARAYLARMQTEGETRREALRCLKRRLSDVVYKALLAARNPCRDPTSPLTRRLLDIEAQQPPQRWPLLLVEPVSAVSIATTQRMLRGIRDRAERATPG
jgi:hypothetical protein